MSHVVMQAAEFGSIAEAKRAEAELLELVERYTLFEKTDADPWGRSKVPPPLVELGARHGVAWPVQDQSLFLLKGTFPDVVGVVQVERMLFFHGGGFELGGETLREVFGKMGAVAVAAQCHLVIRAASAQARVAELTSFLEEEDYEDQFEVRESWQDALFSITVDDGESQRCLVFDDSGVQDWAFVSLLPQLEGDAPRLRRSEEDHDHDRDA